MSSLSKALSEALEHPEEWEVCREVALHTPSGTLWWIANGPLFFNGHDPTPSCLGLIERHWLYYKLMRMIRRKVAAQLMARMERKGGRVESR